MNPATCNIHLITHSTLVADYTTNMSPICNRIAEYLDDTCTMSQQIVTLWALCHKSHTHPSETSTSCYCTPDGINPPPLPLPRLPGKVGMQESTAAQSQVVISHQCFRLLLHEIVTMVTTQQISTDATATEISRHHMVIRTVENFQFLADQYGGQD